MEVTQSGLPVNWLVYTPKTIPTGDYDLIIDTTESHGGRQSLKFVVRECEPTWRHYELEYTSPQKFKRLRFELNVLRPGTFWVDDVTISGISEG